MNHRKYAEELSRAMESISDKMEPVLLMARVMNTPAMREHISKLYAKVFEFLRKALEWYTSSSKSKVKNAFNADLCEKLSQQVQDVGRASDAAAQHAKACSLAEVRDVRLTGEDTNRLARHTYLGICEIAGQSDTISELSRSNSQLADSNSRLEAKNEDLRRRLEDADKQIQAVETTEKRARIGSELAELLGSFARDQTFKDITLKRLQTSEEQSWEIKISSIIRQSTRDLEEAPDEPMQSNCSIEDIQESLQSLEEFIVGESGSSFASRCTPAFAGNDVVHKLQEWSNAEESQLLWLAGDGEPSIPSTLSAAAGSVIISATKLNIPVISHICSLENRSERGLSSQESGLIGLLYSMISQMLIQVPKNVQGLIDMSVKRLSQLDGTMETWDVALGLLADLLSVAPPLLLCIIDGLDVLDSGQTAAKCVDILSLFWEPFASSSMLKVLLTTSGLSGAMFREVGEYLYMVEGVSPLSRETGELGGDSPLATIHGHLEQVTPIELRTEGET